MCFYIFYEPLVEVSSVFLAFMVALSHFVINFILLYYTRRSRRGENHIFELSHFSSYLIEIKWCFYIKKPFLLYFTVSFFISHVDRIAISLLSAVSFLFAHVGYSYSYGLRCVIREPSSSGISLISLIFKDL